MRPWLRLLERIQGLPIEQLDQHMARTLADELGVPYQPVRGWGGGGWGWAYGEAGLVRRALGVPYLLVNPVARGGGSRVCIQCLPCSRPRPVLA